jgi:hypothetical protein
VRRNHSFASWSGDEPLTRELPSRERVRPCDQTEASSSYKVV